MMNYREERDQLNAKLTDTVRAIAGHMKGWSVGPKKENRDHYDYLKNGEKEIRVTYDWQTKKRLVFRGQWPDYHKIDGQSRNQYFSFHSSDKILEGKTTEITTAWDRKPKAIARDIENRLLPSYAELFEVAKTRIAQEEAQQRGKNERIRMVAELLGEKVREEWLREGSYPDLGWYKGIRVKVGYTDFDLAVSITDTEQLKKIVGYIQSVRGTVKP